MIVDTTFVIDLLQGDDEVKEWVEKFDSGEENPVLTSISIMELWEGAHLSDQSKEELEKLRELLDGLTHESFDLEDGKLSGEISTALTKNGDKIDREDVMIGAIAINTDQRVLTRNHKHFEKIEGLKLKTY